MKCFVAVFSLGIALLAQAADKPIAVSANDSQPGTGSVLEKPNIVIFYVDDLGWQDVQLNDLGDPCPYETPNLVKLAEAGMSFSQAYASAPSCSPSRAGILTGQHPAKIGITHVDLGLIKKARSNAPYMAPYLDAHLNLDLLTLADAMKQNGYKTGHVGKWHIGLTAAEYGFDFVDHDRGFHRGMADRTKDFATATDRRYPLSKEKYPPVSAKNPEGISYPYDQLTESALKFMEESKDGPFCINVWHWMVHWPVLTRNGDLLEYYCDKMGYPFPPKPGDMTREGQQNPYFGAMVTSVDWSLGRVVDYLKKTDDPRHPGKKLIETTYIFFSSDNGGAEKHKDEIISDNYPLKCGKTRAEEGGVRVPMVVTGPGVPSGSRFDTMVSQLDYFPTILKLTGSRIAPEYKKELSGLDISPVLAGRSQKVVDAAGKERQSLFWHFPHSSPDHMQAAIREGDFKLYKKYTTGNYELYRLYKNGKRADIEEKKDLANQPEYGPVVERLSAHLEEDLKANNAKGPYLNPAFSKKSLPSAEISSVDFAPATRMATLTLAKGSTGIREAHLIFRRVAAGTHRPGAVDSSVRLPASMSEDGRVVTADVPAEVPAFCFLIIDENNYQIASTFVEAK
jgi:arylsulfatase A-like enzyme